MNEGENYLVLMLDEQMILPQQTPHFDHGRVMYNYRLWFLPGGTSMTLEEIEDWADRRGKKLTVSTRFGGRHGQ